MATATTCGRHIVSLIVDVVTRFHVVTVIYSLSNNTIVTTTECCCYGRPRDTKPNTIRAKLRKYNIAETGNVSYVNYRKTNGVPIRGLGGLESLQLAYGLRNKRVRMRQNMVFSTKNTKNFLGTAPTPYPSLRVGKWHAPHPRACRTSTYYVGRMHRYKTTFEQRNKRKSHYHHHHHHHPHPIIKSWVSHCGKPYLIGITNILPYYVIFR